ncbi:MAG TPA: type II toxin-antitoxin system RelE/ParE family toxin [Candidatus Obscuribacterales bacterium]
MAWQIRWDDRARRELLAPDRQIQRDIICYLDERITTAANPRAFGKPLLGNLAGLWRYRVRDYRIICDIRNESSEILVLRIAHRRHVYDV